MNRTGNSGRRPGPRSRPAPLFYAWALAPLLGLPLLAGCSKAQVAIPPLSDEPSCVAAAVEDLPEYVPAFGVAGDGFLRVTLAQKDGPRVRPGQEAWVKDGSGPATLRYRVVKVIPDVDLATGRSIAWLKAAGGPGLPAGDFVTARILWGMERRALTIPRAALYIRDGRTLAILKQKGADGGDVYAPVPVETGVSTDSDVEIVSGLKAGQEVVVGAGIGLLYPDFKADADD